MSIVPIHIGKGVASNLAKSSSPFRSTTASFEAIRARPATQRAYARAQEVNPPNAPQPTAEETRKILYGQDASTVRR